MRLSLGVLVVSDGHSCREQNQHAAKLNRVETALLFEMLRDDPLFADWCLAVDQVGVRNRMLWSVYRSSHSWGAFVDAPHPHSDTLSISPVLYARCVLCPTLAGESRLLLRPIVRASQLYQVMPTRITR